MKVRLNENGAVSYFGTAECDRVTFDATIVEEYFGIRGIDLIMAGACKLLISAKELYLFEADEVEIIS